MTILKIISIVFAVFVPVHLIAQGSGEPKCGSGDLYNRQIASDKNFQTNQKKIENTTARFIKNGGSTNLFSRPTTTINIPVVIHVLWNQPNQQISLDQIQSQLDVLYNDFQLLNPDRFNTPVPFQPLQANCQITFCLAKKDPNGLPTTGILYKHTEREWFLDYLDDAKYSILGGDDAWDSESYLNIWVVPGLKNFLFQNYYGGYAQFPGGNPATDGVVIVHSEFGTMGSAYDLGRTATHEIGHWLNLKHIWGMSLPILDCLDGDNVDDTPNQDGPNHNCPEFPHLSCNNGPNGDMFMNYMDYTDDNCMNMFTLGQKERMLALFEPGGARASLLNSSACNGDPDLIIINQTANPLSVSAGGNLDLTFKEENVGYASAAPNYVSFHLSTNEILTPGLNGDIFIDDFLVNQTISPQTQTGIFNKQITIPVSVIPGTYHLFFSADGSGVVSEGDETNNFATVIITVTGNCADLIVINQSATPITILAGNSTTLSFQESNIGNGPASANYVSFHLSSDNILTPGQNGDIFLDDHHVNQIIGPLSQTSLISKVVTIPFAVSTGSYYLFFSADGTGSVAECNNLNNFATVLINITSTQPVLPAYRYWFDNNFTNAVTVAGSFGNNYTIQPNISTIFLKPGLHSFTIGFRDNNQKWSSYITSLFISTNNNSPGGSAKFEYWFDKQFTNRVVRGYSGSSELILLENFNSSSLSSGLHTLNVRFKPDARHWSSVATNLFYKPTLVPSGSPQYEYWIDNDFAGKTTSSISSTNDFILLSNIDVASIANGLHSFNIRFRPNGKTWSSITTALFYKIDPALTGSPAFEYWFDSSYSTRTLTNISTTDNLILLNNLATTTLSNGIHTFYTRFRPDGKKWSSTVASFFYKDNDALTPINNLARYIYWFDNNWQDPKTITIVGVQNLNWTLNTNVEELSEGPHVLSQAFKDDRGKWSSIISSNFNREPITTPLCQYTNRQFSSGVIAATGSTFQWQVNSGSGYTNLTDDAIHSGSLTETLTLTNAPTSWYGYLYRCVVTSGSNIMNGPVHTLKFAMTWNGSVNNAWENPANWNCNLIPDANTDVYINANTIRYPEVNGSTACRKLLLQPGTSIEVKTGINLTITGKD